MLSTQKSYGLSLKVNGENLKVEIRWKVVVLWVCHCWDSQVYTWEMKLANVKIITFPGDNAIILSRKCANLFVNVANYWS